jgi:hypothetical protein
MLAPWESDPVAEKAPPQAAPANAPWAADAPAEAPADATATPSDQSPPQALPGFTDEQKQQILEYLPKAKDAADLERFSSELTQGRSKIGNAKDVLDKFSQGHRQFGWTPPTPAAPPPQQKAPMDAARDAIGDGILESIDTFFPGVGTFLRQHRDAGKAFTEHVANSAAMDYGPEVGGLIDTIIHPGSDLHRNIAHERAILEGDSADHPIASIAGELGGVGVNAMLGNEAGLANLSTAAKTGVGAVTGGAYGSGAAGPDNRVGGAITGAALGTATEAAAAGLAARSAAKTAAKAANSDFAQAAERQGVDYMAADLPKAMKSKFATSLSALTLGGIPLAEQGAKNTATAAAAVERTASNIGTVADKTGAGQAAQRGARQFVSDTADTLNSLESKIPVPSDAPAVVNNTRGALTNLAQSFKSNPKLAEAFKDPKIAAYLDALTPQTSKEATGLVDAAGNPITRDVTHGGGLSWNDLRDFRTRVGQIIGQPGLTSDGVQIGQLRALYGSLSDDIKATAQKFGPQAENAWNRWNNFARARSDRIENVVSLILGKDQNKGPQSAFEALQRLAADKGGDPLKLARALRSMPEEEAGSVRATILDDLGHATAGNQNDAETVFSPANFVTQWNKLSDRTKNVLFTGEHRDAINDLAKIFSGMKASTKFANSSKTGIGVIASTHTVPALIANPVLGMLDMALQYGGGKLLSSPAVARKIAGTPLSVKGATSYWSRPWVKGLALKNPAIAGEIQAFQHAFLSHANDNSGVVGSAVASPDAQQQDQQQ